VKFAPALDGRCAHHGQTRRDDVDSSQYGANTLTATLAVEKALADLEPRSRTRITLYSGLHRPANFIERA